MSRSSFNSIPFNNYSKGNDRIAEIRLNNNKKQPLINMKGKSVFNNNSRNAKHVENSIAFSHNPDVTPENRNYSSTTTSNDNSNSNSLIEEAALRSTLKAIITDVYPALHAIYTPTFSTRTTINDFGLRQTTEELPLSTPDYYSSKYGNFQKAISVSSTTEDNNNTYTSTANDENDFQLITDYLSLGTPIVTSAAPTT